MKARIRFNYDFPVAGGVTVHCQTVAQDNNSFKEVSKQLDGSMEKDCKYGLCQRDECEELLMKNSSELGPYPNNGYNPYRGAVVGLKNGNSFADDGLNVTGKDGIKRNFLALTIYCNIDDTIWDDINGYTGMNIYEYIEMLKKDNPKLRMDNSMFIGTPWTDEAAKLFKWLSIRR